VILFHRISTILILALVASGFGILMFWEVHASVAMICFVMVLLLFGRLLLWEFKRGAFWVFWMSAVAFLGSAVFFYLFLELAAIKLVLAVVVTIALWLYAENLFAFYHLPGSYQAYALEYLSLVIYLLSAFFFTSGAYGAQLFLLLPVWVPALAVFWAVTGAIAGIFWVSKIDNESAGYYAFVGGLLLTELYVVLSFLPTSFMTNAAAFTCFLYLYFGITRAYILERLSRFVFRRYAAVAGLLLFFVFLTARWV